MDSEQRDRLNQRSLTQSRTFVLGDFKLRPISAGSMELCRQVGLDFIDGGAKNASAGEVQRQLTGILYIHSMPLDEVLEACEKTPEEFDKFHRKPFSFEVPISVLFKMTDFIDRELERVEAAKVDIKEKPSVPGAKRDAEPPNS